MKKKAKKAKGSRKNATRKKAKKTVPDCVQSIDSNIKLKIIIKGKAISNILLVLYPQTNGKKSNKIKDIIPIIPKAINVSRYWLCELSLSSRALIIFFCLYIAIKDSFTSPVPIPRI
jgi:uncharacterized protein with FMN-binding domain